MANEITLKVKVTEDGNLELITNKAKAAGYNDYLCNSPTDCVLCGCDGELVKCTKFRLDLR